MPDDTTQTEVIYPTSFTDLKIGRKFHAVNLRLNRDLPVERQISDWIRQDLADGVNLSKKIKILLYAHYLEKLQVETATEGD
jgi:hypothetical protein